MSFELYLAPADGFLDWSGEQWDAFFEGEPESEQLGNAAYVGMAEEAIVRNLEVGQSGSKYPLLLGRRTNDVIGWYAHEIPQLQDEIRAVRTGLAGLPINRLTLARETDEEVRQIVQRFQSRKPDGRMQSLCDLFAHYVDTFERMSEKAKASGRGLWLSF